MRILEARVRGFEGIPPERDSALVEVEGLRRELEGLARRREGLFGGLFDEPRIGGLLDEKPRIGGCKGHRGNGRGSGRG